MCSSCYRYATDKGFVHEYPKVNRSREDVAAEVIDMEFHGTAVTEIVETLGTKPSAIGRSLRRSGLVDLARKFGKLAQREARSRKTGGTGRS